jgi:nucleotide-binding universal stress UspA family protein
VHGREGKTQDGHGNTVARSSTNTLMIEIRRILCPVDFSDFSRRALAHAVAIARWYESTVTLVHVCAIVPVAAFPPGAAVPPSAGLMSEDRDALLAALKRFADAEVGPNAAVAFDISEGSTAAEILAAADRLPADLLVMGTHGRSGFERLILGSVTERVLAKASCPVLTVPRGVPDVAPVPAVLFKRIVCAIDFSECSRHALTYAMSIAQEADAHLTVVHVLELPPDDVLARSRGLHEYVEIAGGEARVRLREAVPDSVRAYCTVDTVLATGKPYREILRIAGEQQADLVVIGSRGRGAIDRLLFGSTAQHLVRQATCPVLTLR